MTPAALHISAVSKHYDSKCVLDALQLSVQPGESIGLVGVNGAGKTTLIKSILDLHRIDSGKVEIFAESHLNPESRRRVAYLPERFSAPPHFNGRDYLKFMLHLNNIKLDNDKIAAAFHSLDLPLEALKKSVKNYSKGMMQKLGLISCFLLAKDLIILDEPMSGLDPLARTLLKNSLAELKAAGHTLFISTHMLTDVATVCDRMLVLHKAEIQF